MQDEGDLQIAKKYLGYADSFLKELLSPPESGTLWDAERRLIACIAMLRAAHEIRAGGGHRLSKVQDEDYVCFIGAVRHLRLHKGGTPTIELIHIASARRVTDEEAAQTGERPGVYFGPTTMDFSFDEAEDIQHVPPNHRTRVSRYVERHNGRITSAVIEALERTRVWFD